MSSLYEEAPDTVASSSDRLLGNIDILAAPHWAAALEGRLVFQRCLRCAYVRWPAAGSCPECLSVETEWAEVSPLGQIWSFCTYERLVQVEASRDVPYVVGAIQLDEGPFLITNIVDSKQIEIGQRVTAVYTRLSDEKAVVNFRCV
jgi:uncharacterized protein